MLVSDFAGVGSMAISTFITSNAATTARLMVQYSTTLASPSWIDTNIIVNLPTTTNTGAIGSYVALPTTMRGIVLVRVVMTNGNGTETPALRAVRLHIKP
jgi:hypothetical protein